MGYSNPREKLNSGLHTKKAGSQIINIGSFTSPVDAKEGKTDEVQGL